MPVTSTKQCSQHSVPIKISCSTFIAQISLQFIILAIEGDIYLRFTSNLLNIYHFNGS